MPIVYSSTHSDNPPRDSDEDSITLHGETSHSLLHTYCLYPKDVVFESQYVDEKVILFLRAHPITQLPWVLTAIVGLIAPTFVNLIVGNYFSLVEIIFVNLLWHSVLLSYVIINLLSWQFNVGIITNLRVVDHDFNNILSKEFSATIIENIEDVTARSIGFIASIFHYGSIYVQTAGATENIQYINVPNTTSIVKIINKLMREHGQNA